MLKALDGNVILAGCDVGLERELAILQNHGVVRLKRSRGTWVANFDHYRNLNWIRQGDALDRDLVLHAWEWVDFQVVDDDSTKVERLTGVGGRVGRILHLQVDTKVRAPRLTVVIVGVQAIKTEVVVRHDVQQTW